MQSLYIYNLSFPHPSHPRIIDSLCTPMPLSNAGPFSGSLVPTWYSHAFSVCLVPSALPDTLSYFSLTTVQWRYCISYYRRKRQGLSEWDLPSWQWQIWDPCWRHCFSSGAESSWSRIGRKKSCFWGKGWHLPISPDYLLSHHRV